MIKLCGKSIAYPLKLIFESSLLGGEFTECWKRANVVSAHKKESKNLVKNNRPVSLLPMFRKIFERVIFKDLFNYFHKNDLFTKCQSDFLPGDSCASQLLSTVHVHDINSSFDYPTQDVRGVFWIFPKLLIKYGTKGYRIN